MIEKHSDYLGEIIDEESAALSEEEEKRRFNE